MHQALAHAASSNGHTYMLWEQLQPDALKLMSTSGQSLHLPCVSATSQLWLHTAAASQICYGLCCVHRAAQVWSVSVRPMYW